jgi:hypothetical protein
MKNYPDVNAEFVSLDFGINDIGLYGGETNSITKYINMLRFALSRVRAGTINEITNANTWSGSGTLTTVSDNVFSGNSYVRITGGTKTLTFNVTTSKFNQYLDVGFVVENGGNANATITVAQSSTNVRNKVTQSLIYDTDVVSDGKSKPIVTRIALPYSNDIGGYSQTYTITIDFSITSGSACIDYWHLENKEIPVAIHEVLKTPYYIPSSYASSLIDDWNLALSNFVNTEFNDGLTFVVNTTDYIGLNSNYFFDDVHPNNEGHQRIALAIYNKLIRRFGKPKLMQYPKDNVLYPYVGISNDFNWSKGIWTNVKTTVIPNVFLNSGVGDARGLPVGYNSDIAYFKNLPEVGYTKDENNRVTWQGLVTKFIVDDPVFSSGAAQNGWCYSSDKAATFQGVWATDINYNVNDVVLTNQNTSSSGTATQYEVAEMPVAYQCIKAHVSNSSSRSLPQPSSGASSYWSPLRFVRSSGDAKPITTIPSTPSNGLRQTTITNIYSGIDDPTNLGEWSASIDYYKGDVVSYKGINYISVAGTTPSLSGSPYSNKNQNPSTDTTGSYWHPLINNTTYTRDSVYGTLAPRYYKNNIVKSRGMSYIALTTSAPNSSVPGTLIDFAYWLPTVGFAEKIADAPAEFLPSTPQTFTITNESGQNSIIQVNSTGLYWYPLNSSFKSKRMAVNSGGPGIPGKMAADFEQYNYHFNMGWIDLSSISYYTD